jgi:mono/diheme cytochrome c family protein
MSKILASVAAVLLLALPALGLAAQAQGDPAKGRQLYVANGCAYCHGTVGQGGGGRTGGLRLAQMGIAFPAFLNQLRHPANEMPPYVDSVVSDQDAAHIHAFIASLPPPPDVKTIPILNN